MSPPKRLEEPNPTPDLRSPTTRLEHEILAHVGEIVVDVGLDGRLRYVSRSAETILGRAPESFAGLSFLEVVIPEDREPALAAFQKVLETGAEPTVPIRIARADGLPIAFEALVRTFQDSSGQRRIIASCRDVTHERAISDVDRERNAHYRTLVEFGPRPAAIIAVDGKIRFSNRRFQSTFGRGSNIRDIMEKTSPETQRTMASKWHRSTQGETSGSVDFEFSDGQREPSWLSCSWEAFTTDEDERLFAVFYADITQRKRVEETLRTIAAGTIHDTRDTARQMLAGLAEALGLDRVVLATTRPDRPQSAEMIAGWHDGQRLDPETIMPFSLEGLPDATVAAGETCLLPVGLHQIMPAVRDQLGEEFESYAGLPLAHNDGEPIGFVSGYSRRPLEDTDLVRSLLGFFATHVGGGFERVRAEQKILENQARFDGIASQSNDLLIEIDEQSRITYVSNASAQLLGMRPEDLIGKTTFDITYPEDHHVLTGSQQSVLEGRPSPPLVTRVPHAQGGLRWFESKVTPFTASNGAGRAIVMSRDITERVHEDLGRDLLYRVVQETTDLIAVCTPDTTLRFANQTAVQLLAPESDESLEGKSLYDFLAPPDAYRLRDEILPELRPDQPWTGSLELVRPDGGEPLSTAATIFLFQGTDETKRSYLAVTLRDETRRRGAEEALRESELRLGQAQKMEAVGRLAGGIAHDFNNLLTAIIGYGDLVLGELDPNQTAWRDTEEILRAAERAGELTRQLLAFSRRQVLTTDSVDLNAIVADIDRMIRRLIGEDIEIVTLQNGELEGVVADRGQLEQVIVNLVVNARDAMPQGGRLTLETLNQEVEQTREVESGPLAPGPYVVLRITDTGIGMDPDTLERIFEPFFTTKEVDQGTGLGLATVYGIVSQSGGQIDVESEIGRGTTFSIYLPSSSQTTENAQPTDLGEPPGGDETILLVEDSAPVRRLVERTLANKGYQVLAAESATAALRHCARHEGPIDLLLCDVVLPRTPGPEVAARTLEMRPGTRVLYISGFSEDILSQHGIERGDPRLLPKPFTPAQLLHALRAQLDTES